MEQDLVATDWTIVHPRRKMGLRARASQTCQEKTLRSIEDRIDAALDAALEMTFPASNPVAISMPDSGHESDTAEWRIRGVIAHHFAQAVAFFHARRATDVESCKHQ
jgi:hypothetical protein